MITLAIINIFANIAKGLLLILPDSTGLTTTAQASVTSVFNYLAPFSYIIDTGVFLTLMTMVFVFESSVMLLYLTLFLSKKVINR